MSVRAIPLLPCPSTDDIADFYEALGFTTTYRQSTPSPYVAVERDGLELHYFGMEGFDPATSYGTCIVLVDDTEPWFEAIAAGLRQRYETLPMSGVPRITRPRLRENAGGLSGFSLIDPGGNAVRFTRGITGEPVMEESRLATAYAYAVVLADSNGDPAEAATLLDGDPLNNYLKRALTFNPDGVLNDANNITIGGNQVYITTSKELVIVNINDPLNPRIVKTLPFKHPQAIAIQFRYGFVVDDDGLKVIDLAEQRIVDGAFVPLEDAHDVYVARTYAYVANGKHGIAIVDVEQPERPRLDLRYNAGGALNDVHQVKIAMTNASLFAYVADGRNGLRILQLTSPETMPEYAGFSPRPRPVLIATFKTKGDALAISKPLDRDRAVDESGNQISVFGRRGARPFTYEEMLRMLRTNDGKGDWFRVKQ